MTEVETLVAHESFSLNLLSTRSTDYMEIEARLFESIARHLDPDTHRISRKVKPTDSVNLSFFIRRRAIRKSAGKSPIHVFMSHGLADKRYNLIRSPETGKPFLNNFHHALVPGQWMKEKLLSHKDVELTEDRIHQVGWPRLDGLFSQAARAYLPVQGRPKVLWAPSHDFRRYGDGGVRLSTFPEFEADYKRLQQLFETRVSLHPRNREWKSPTEDDLVWADVVISDFGTMVYEAWALGKTVVFPRWILGNRIIDFKGGTAEAQIFEQKIGLHPSSFDELVDLLHASHPLGVDVTNFMSHYLDPATLGSAGRRAASALIDIHRANFGADL